MGQVSARTRALVLTRDGHDCAARGVLPGLCGGHLDMGHIVGRGMGGTPDGDVFDQPQWIVTHCRTHNGLIETQPDVRSSAEANGHRLSRSLAVHRAGATVRYADGWYHLYGDGQRVPLPPVPAWQVPA